MKDKYAFEPSRLEILTTELIGNTFARFYYRRLVQKLEVAANDKVLDYCSGSGIISKEILKKIELGHLIYADVSKKWIIQAAKKLQNNKNVNPKIIRNFHGKISGGEYDKIFVHFSLHDFPKEFRALIVNQLAENLKPSGTLYIREPLGNRHGIQLYELINLLEFTKKLSYEYKIVKNRFIGEYVDIVANLKIN